MTCSGWWPTDHLGCSGKINSSACFLPLIFISRSWKKKQPPNQTPTLKIPDHISATYIGFVKPKLNLAQSNVRAVQQ